MTEPHPDPLERQPLTRSRILEAALALVERDGAEALTIRRLAGELDAGAMSLYHHVPNREALLDGLSETMVGEVDVGGDSPDWRDALRRFMTGIRAVAHSHPQAFRLVGMRPLNTRDALPPIEAALAAMRAGGFDEEEAFYAYRAVVAYARGYALAEISGFTLEPAAADDGGRLIALDLGRDEFPAIAAMATHIRALDREAAFAFGMDALVAGLEQRVGAGRAQ